MPLISLSCRDYHPCQNELETAKSEIASLERQLQEAKGEAASLQQQLCLSIASVATFSQDTANLQNEILKLKGFPLFLVANPARSCGLCAGELGGARALHNLDEETRQRLDLAEEREEQRSQRIRELEAALAEVTQGAICSLPPLPVSPFLCHHSCVTICSLPPLPVSPFI